MQNNDNLDNEHNESSELVVAPMVKVTLALTKLKTLTEKLCALITASISQLLIKITLKTSTLL